MVYHGGVGVIFINLQGTNSTLPLPQGILVAWYGATTKGTIGMKILFSSSYNISGLVPVCWLLFQCFWLRPADIQKFDYFDPVRGLF